MKRTLLIWMLIHVFQTMNAQEVIISGPVLGMKISKPDTATALVPSEGNGDTLLIRTGDRRITYQLGGFVRFPIDFMFFQTGILASTTAYTYHLTNPRTRVQTNLDVRTWQVDVPVSLGVKLGPIHAFAGLTGTIHFPKGTAAKDDYGNDLLDMLQLSWHAGAGLDIWRFVLDVRYEQPFGQILDIVKYNNSRFDNYYKDRSLVIALAFRLQRPDRFWRKKADDGGGGSGQSR